MPGYPAIPAMMADVARGPKFAGHPRLNRFLFATPASRIGRREIAPPPVTSFARGGYRGSLRNLLTIEGYCDLTLSPEAEALLKDWETEIEAQLDEAGSLAGIPEWGSRLPGATLRIAAILHLFDNHPESPVSSEMMSAAIAIGRYLIPHALAAFERMGVLPPRPGVGEHLDTRVLIG